MEFWGEAISGKMKYGQLKFLNTFFGYSGVFKHFNNIVQFSKLLKFNNFFPDGGYQNSILTWGGNFIDPPWIRNIINSCERNTIHYVYAVWRWRFIFMSFDPDMSQKLHSLCL